LDGKLLTRDQPKHRKIYEGPEGVVHIYLCDGVLWLSATYELDLKKRDNLYQTIAVVEAVFEALRQKGVKYVYCFAGSPESFKFNEMLGFRAVNAVVHDKYEVMEKEL
jgi:hypothetical protein